jgi:hypothetical protein
MRLDNKYAEHKPYYTYHSQSEAEGRRLSEAQVTVSESQ